MYCFGLGEYNVNYSTTETIQGGTKALAGCESN